MRRAARMSSLMLLALMAGCSATKEASRMSGAAGGDMPLQLDASSDRQQLGYGEEITIRLVVANPGDQEIQRQFTSGCIYGFALVDGAGEVVAPPPPMCSMVAPTVRWPAGQEVVQEFRWRWDDRELAAGRYWLRAGLGPRGELAHAALLPLELR